MSLPLTFNVTAFRTQFSVFANDATYTNDMLLGWWNVASLYISPCNYGWLYGASRAQALNLMTAHLASLNDMIRAGETPGIVIDSQIDKIRISLEPPPGKSQFDYWLNQTPYGQQLLALLSIKSVGGMIVGGSPQRAAFLPSNCFGRIW